MLTKHGNYAADARSEGAVAIEDSSARIADLEARVALALDVMEEMKDRMREHKVPAYGFDDDIARVRGTDVPSTSVAGRGEGK